MRGLVVAGALALALVGCGSSAVTYSGDTKAWAPKNLPSQQVAAGQYRVTINGAECFSDTIPPNLAKDNNQSNPAVQLVDQHVVSIPATGSYTLLYIPNSDSCSWSITLTPSN